MIAREQMEHPITVWGLRGQTQRRVECSTKSLTANAVLPPGVYWLAFLDTVADSVHTRTMAVAGLGAIMQTSATNLTVLPSTAGTVADSVLLIELYALISGGFS